MTEGGHQGSISCRWQFASDGGDIGFGVFLKTKMGERQRAGEMTEVLASQRYNAHLVPEDGSLTCNEAGVCKYRRVCLSLSVATSPLLSVCLVAAERMCGWGLGVLCQLLDPTGLG